MPLKDFAFSVFLCYRPIVTRRLMKMVLLLLGPSVKIPTILLDFNTYDK